MVVEDQSEAQVPLEVTLEVALGAILEVALEEALGATLDYLMVNLFIISAETSHVS